MPFSIKLLIYPSISPRSAFLNPDSGGVPYSASFKILTIGRLSGNVRVDPNFFGQSPFLSILNWPACLGKSNLQNLTQRKIASGLSLMRRKLDPAAFPVSSLPQEDGKQKAHEPKTGKH